MKRKTWLSILCFWAFSSPLYAKRSSELVYVEPFDLAAGGTTLTRASQEGIVFANPALLPLGAAKIRWLGFQAGFIVDRELLNSGGKLSNENSSTESEGEGEGEESAEGDPETDSTDQFFERSLHAGQTATLSVLNENFALTVFERLEIDAAGSRFGDGGLPGIELGVEAYAGVLGSLASRPFRWLSLGATAKYLMIGEPQIMIPIANQAKFEAIGKNPKSFLSELKYGKGTGIDVGGLLLWQNPSVDLSLGLKIEDLGDTQISNDQEALPQNVNVGLGLAFHGAVEVLHLSLDYRDVLGAYPTERTFKKIFAGARLMIRQRFGIGIGLYQGIPSVGLRLDLLIFKFGITAYGRELGAYPGQKQRNLITLYTSIGV